MLSPKDIVLVARMREAGIRNPIWTLQAARKTGLPVPLACALLDQETGGGRNVWGHDPTIYIGGPTGDNRTVTQADYLAYKKKRGVNGQGGMQGVGPCQLTYYSYQDKADTLGGCWTPLANLTVGFELAATLIRRNGIHPGVAAYNGSGPAAEHYADSVLARETVWAKRLGVPSIVFTKKP